MWGGSSTTPGDTLKQEHPSSFLGATGQAGSVALDEASTLKEESPLARHSAVSVSEGARRWEQYCVIVWVVTAQDQKPLQSYAWNEGLLNDFFKAMIGIPYSVIITSNTECKTFAPGCLRDIGMSFDDSIQFCHTFSGIHTWVGIGVQVTALQQTLKEGQHNVTKAKEFTHERTKQWIVQLHSVPTMPSPMGSSKQHPAMESPHVCGMTCQVDCLYMQDTLCNMDNLAMNDTTAHVSTAEPRHQVATPEPGQYDSAEQELNNDDLVSQLEFDGEEYDKEEMGC